MRIGISGDAGGRVTAVWLGADGLECALAQGMLAPPGCRPAWPRFGASDCRCPVHLLRWEQPVAALDALLRQCWGMAPLSCTARAAPVEMGPGTPG